MSLTPARFPTHFEGEIQCSINWEANDEQKEEIKSIAATNNNVENQEFLFLRLKKRTKFVSIQIIILFFNHVLYNIEERPKSNRIQRERNSFPKCI